MADITYIGSTPFERDGDGKLRTRIGTVFPSLRCVVAAPTIHAMQRQLCIDYFNERREANGESALTRAEESEIWNQAVDLIFEEDRILIRPNPEDMPLAFEADELLQEIVPKYKIRYLYALDKRVRHAVKQRGECWRITALPTKIDEMRQMIADSKLALSSEEIYYYNRTTGTRWLTCECFANLERCTDSQLRAILDEIRVHCGRVNPRGYPEIDFFQAEKSFSYRDLEGYEFSPLDSHTLRQTYTELREKFFAAVDPEFHHNDPEDANWRNRMFTALIAQADEIISEETLLGLSCEFFMQIQWLPGGRIEDGELIFDSTFDLFEEQPENADLKELCDDRARGFIFNFVREHSNLEYVNIGRVVNSLSRRRDTDRRRGVYIAEVKRLDEEEEMVSIIRMQKWGVQEHLDDHKPPHKAIVESDEYTEYVLDRRLGCRQFGMNLPRCVIARKVAERYYSEGNEWTGSIIWSPYIERDYIRGLASDKILKHRLADPEYALKLGKLLGDAAAVNIVVGRCDRHGRVLFDDGDEVIIENDQGLPEELIVADPTGTFQNFTPALTVTAPFYAGPVNRRREDVPDPARFAEVYLKAFGSRFRRLQAEYRRRRRAFDTLFKYRNWDPNGGFAFRWEQVLMRLDRTNPVELLDTIRASIDLPTSVED